jgi:hypothetical protein
MDEDEHRGVVRSLIAKLIGSLVFGGIAAVLSLQRIIHLDVYSAAIVGFLFFFCIGCKFFPESSKYIGRRARNFRRARKGLEPLDVADEPTAEIITDFQRNP